MAQHDWLMDELVAGYRILAREGVVDAMGHLSVRHPDKPGHFLISGSRAPLLVRREDVMTCRPDGEPIDANGRQPYIERFIHAALYEARPDVHAVIHNH